LDAIDSNEGENGKANFSRSSSGLNDTSFNIYGNTTWGGLGGLDGKGGLGYGVMYCISKIWWDNWSAYVRWSWAGESEKNNSLYDQQMNYSERPERPCHISTEILIDQSLAVRGTMGSYEMMKKDLRMGEDFVLVPPIVWDILYELYGGGPSLPRMVLPPTYRHYTAESPTTRTKSFSKEDESVEIIVGGDLYNNLGNIDCDLDGSNFSPSINPFKIPDDFKVEIHPWILHCHVCDPHQPYRRGDAGPISIRIMASPSQPLWRLFAEIVVRLPINHPRGKDFDGKGRARLWKKVFYQTAQGAQDSTSSLGNKTSKSSTSSRYGPWTLLCKNRHAAFPVGDNVKMEMEEIEIYRKEWESFVEDSATVQAIGLQDGDCLMFEYALLGKDGNFTWPREAAAKAGRLRRVADEDSAFRLKIRGLNSEGKHTNTLQDLLGEVVDAMDASGRWYEAKIIQINISSSTNNSGDQEKFYNGKSVVVEEKHDGDHSSVRGEIQAVRVHFNYGGGHEEWIEVDSDRLAVAGRFTLDSMKSFDVIPSDDSGDASKRTIIPRRGSKESNVLVDSNLSNSDFCSFPGFGACGLTNLGNTCYANSAIQCISYIPLLRSYLLSSQYKINGDLNKDNPLGTGGKLLEEFSDLLKVMWSGKYNSRAPRAFRHQLGRARQQYAGADQQDAQELLNDMIDSLHEDSNKVKQKPYVEGIEDFWVKNTSLSRVGEEAWRRFLRRNRSVITNVAMGQVLNRVTCPVCNHSSLNFDPFNMLSIPFPTASEVHFRCQIMRSASALNCPDILNRGKISIYNEAEPDFFAPSEYLIMEEHNISMPRLADIGDLKLRLQNFSGISSKNFKLCKVEEVKINADLSASNVIQSYFKLHQLSDKEGPCLDLAKKTNDLNSSAISTTFLIAFESTLKPRPHQEDTPKKEVSKLPREERGSNSIESTLLQQQLKVYGNKLEAKLYDTNPFLVAKAMSRNMWPRSQSDFKLGLRVDAIDQKNQWFQGSVIEIIQGNNSENESESGRRDVKKVRIHFDNFSSKWDEMYTIDNFNKGQVKPLYSHATPKEKPTEFVVHHRRSAKSFEYNVLFGLPFYVQCHIEWSTARAGAHILAQLSRFLQPPTFKVDKRGAIKSNSDGSTTNDFLRRNIDNKKDYQASDETRQIISQIIDELIEADKRYVEYVLSSENQNKSEESNLYAASLSSNLYKKLNSLLPLLPFDIILCSAESPVSKQDANGHEEISFPFSLVRTIGNFINARHAIAIHWHHSSKMKNSMLYIHPQIGFAKGSQPTIDGESVSDLGKRTASERWGKSNDGLHLGVCLDEFCKKQRLKKSECWRCPKCKEVREGQQDMRLWRLPDILTFHLKRFNCSARWREKITTKVNFPLNGLNMEEWCDNDSPTLERSDGSCIYDLFGVVNHYGGMTGGHYVATCKASPCGADGSEEVGHSFNGAGVHSFDINEGICRSSGWKLGRNKEKESNSQQAKSALSAAKALCESSEPLWLQFDDDLVEPIPPKSVVSEMAYVLFYRRRNISPSNIAKYCTLD